MTQLEKQYSPIFLAVAVVLLSFTSIRGILWLSGKSQTMAELSIVGVLVTSVLLTVYFKDVSYPKFLTTFSRWLAAICLAYIALQYPLFPIIKHQLFQTHTWIQFIWICALGSCIIGWFKTPILLLAGVYIPWIKLYASHATGMPYRTTLDIIPLYQLTIFIAITAVVGGLLTKLEVFRAYLNPVTRFTFFCSCFFCLLSFHIAGYFFSGIEKAGLDGGILHWPFKNNLQNIFYVVVNNQQLIWQNSDNLLRAVNSITNVVTRPLSVVVFFSQLLAICAFSSKRLMIALLLIYDFMHLGIFFLVGANFMTWFFVNLALVSTIALIPKSFFGLRQAIAAGCLIFLCQYGVNKVYQIPQLGWYDSLAVNNAYFKVETSDRKIVKIPTTHFTFYSYPLGHMSYGHPDGYYVPTATNGGTDFVDILLKAEQCGFEPTDLQSPYPYQLDTVAFSNYIRAYHQQLLDFPPRLHELMQTVYWHHFWPPYDAHNEATILDISKFIRYELSIDATCLIRDGEMFRSKVINREKFAVDL